MNQRMDYLIGADKAFHHSVGADYETTVLYRDFLLGEHVNAENLFYKETS